MKITQKLKTYWQLFWKFRQLALMKLLEYRGNFFFWTFIATIWTTFNLFFFELLTNLGPKIGGWSKYEIYVLIGIFTMLDAFMWSVCWQNMRRYTQMIFNGELNQLLVRPIDAQSLLLIQDNSYNNLPRLFIGLIVVIKALEKLRFQPSWWQVLAAAIAFLLAMAMLYLIWFILATGAFWVEKLDNINQILPRMRQIWQVPRSVYTGLASLIFTILLPVTLTTSIPSEILLGKSSLWWLAYLTLIVFCLLIFSRWFFRISIKKYTGIAN